jgi:hypothetical protein
MLSAGDTFKNEAQPHLFPFSPMAVKETRRLMQGIFFQDLAGLGIFHDRIFKRNSEGPEFF